MSGLVRAMMGLALATALAACSAQTGNAPTGPGAGSAPAPAAKAITNPPQNHLPKPGHGIHPADQIGGGVGKRLMVRLGDAALPNGSKIQAINLGIDQILATDAYGNVTTVAQYTSPQVVNVLCLSGRQQHSDRRRQRREHGLHLADDRRRYGDEHLHHGRRRFQGAVVQYECRFSEHLGLRYYDHDHGRAAPGYRRDHL